MPEDKRFGDLWLGNHDQSYSYDYWKPRPTPTGYGKAAGNGGAIGRNIPTSVVEHVIQNGTRSSKLMENGTIRTIHELGDIRIITEEGGKIVVTVIRI